ncbi:MAG TPA: helix-turn-helix domain-containing protein [Steroidobacteraceae bacterium]|nr:helix-turn-helix domain-containing protein [Steroidobacteraceae bacterium]
MKHRQLSRHLVAGLIHALDWFDNSLQAILESRRLKVVNRTQSMMVVHIASGITQPIDLAREMHLSRQNIHYMAKGLIEAGILEFRPDPHDRRSGHYVFGRKLGVQRRAAREILGYLEERLAERIGPSAVEALRAALTADWGEEITRMPVGRRSAPRRGEPRAEADERRATPRTGTRRVTRRAASRSPAGDRNR